MENGLLHVTSGNASAGMALEGCSLGFTGICLPSGAEMAAPNKSVSMDAPYTKQFLAATITGSNGEKAPEMPAEGQGERQSAGTASGGSAQAPAFSDQKQGTPARPPYILLSNGGIALKTSALPDIDDNAREARSHK